MSTNPEQMLISAILRSKDHVTASARGITVKFFHAYSEEFRFIERYIAIRKRAPSEAAFIAKFPKFRVKPVDDVEHFCDEVKHSHLRANLSQAVSDIISSLDDDNLEDALDLMHSKAITIESEIGGQSNDSDIFEHWEDTFDEVMRRTAQNANMGQAGLPTGFPTLDERTGGPQPGHFWVVAARLGQGKTWSLARMACAAAFSGFTVQYNAFEGTRAEIAMRVHTFASSEYGKTVFKNRDIAMGQNFSPRDYKEFLIGLRKDVEGKFHIADNSKGAITLMTMAAQMERNKPDGVFLDYIQIADTSGDEDMRMGLAKFSKGLKMNAERYGVPIIAAAQLNREAANRKDNGPENIAETDAIGRDADAVIVMRQLSKRVILFKLAKYRHGRDGYVWYTKFLPNTGHFEECTYDEAMDCVAEDKDDEEDESPVFKPRKKGSFKEVAERRKQNVAGKKIVVPKKRIIKPTKAQTKRIVKKRAA